MRISSILLAVLPAVLCACVVDDDPPDVASSDASLIHDPDSPLHLTFHPSDTSLEGYGPIGSGNTTWRPNHKHYAYRPAVPASGPRRLVVFLPGCGGQPSQYTDFMETARDQGYYVIGLDYPNPCGLNNDCGTDLSCAGKYRREVSIADDTTTLVTLETHRQDAINKRLKAALLYLFENDLLGHWEDFIDSDSSAEDGFRPLYSHIVFAGHSLGAGYAAYFGHLFTVDRVIMISNPADAVDACTTSTDPGCLDTHPVACNWLDDHPTPNSAYWGLAHVQDTSENKINRIKASWTSIAVPSTHKNIEQNNVPASCGGVGPHTAVAQCASAYAHYWIDMLGTP